MKRESKMEKVRSKMEDCHTDSELLTQFHKKSPQLRFSGFGDEWEEKKLGDVSDRVTRKNEKLESTLPLTISAQYGLVDQITFFNNQVASTTNLRNYFLVKNGEFAYNKSYSAGYPWGAIKRLDRYEKGVLSTLYIVFKPKNINSDYLLSYYDTDKWYKQVSEIAAEGARNHGLLNIAPNDFFQTTFYAPLSELEQQKIGTFLSHVDSLIQAKTKKLESLKAVKKSLLQKCFPKTDEKVPEMRFAGFSGNWEEKKLGEVAEISSGTTPSRMNSENFSGDICWLTSGELKSHYIYDTSEKINESIAETMRTYKKGTVVIAIYGLEAAGIRGTCSILKRDCTISQACMAFTNLKSVHNEFLYCWYIANGNEIGTKYAQGTKQQNLSSDIVSDMSICFPTLAEQQKIGQFFSKYDSLISAQQKEIDKLKDIKKSLLQKMFI